MNDLQDLIDVVVESKPQASEFVEKILQDEIPSEDTADDSATDPVSEIPPPNDTPSPAEVFDPAIHAVDAAGNPKKNANGSFSKKRGRKAGGTSVPGTSNALAVQNASAINAKNAATVTVQTIVTIGHAIGGDEWDAKQEELYSLNAAWTAYYLEVGTIDLPKWLGVVIATGAYSIPRFRKPKTAERMSALWGTLKPGLSRALKFLAFWK